MQDLKMQESQADMRYRNLQSQKLESELNAPPSQEQIKPPAGYMWSPDGKSLVAIQGGPADYKQSKDGRLDAAMHKSILDNGADAIKQIDELIGARDETGKLIEGSKAHPGFESVSYTHLTLPTKRIV